VKTYAGIYQEAVNDPHIDVRIVQGAIEIAGGENGVFLVKDPSQNAMPMLRTQFSMHNKGIKKARLYATARGIYEIYLNGERVGRDYFNPGYTQYNKTHMYQTYDITKLVKNGGNSLGAYLGEGWWSGLLNYGSNWNYFGDRQSLLAKLVITYEDDTTNVITTNPITWKYYHDGPIRYSSFFMGEVYDVTKETAINGWSTDTYDDSQWKHAVEVPSNHKTTWNGYHYDDMKLIGQIGENARAVMTLTAKSVKEVRPNVYVYDMGQNMVGVPRITIKNGKENQKITMRYAEVLYPDLPEFAGSIGMIMQENLRAALNQDTYICKEGKQVITPKFTFHGYRYIEITGIKEALPLEAVQGIVISSILELSSNYATSNRLVNKLWENITWSMRGNFLSIPTDTPARNERMGWNGDISVFSRTATYLADVNQFLKRHNIANRDMQSEAGRYSDVTPVGPGFGGILWGSAGLTVPWEAYQQYGDASILEEHFDSMKKYINYLDTRINTKTGLIDEGPLADWLSPEYEKTEDVLLWTAYHAYDLWIMAKASEVLGYEEEARLFLEKYHERKEFFNRKFVDTQTKKTINSNGILIDTQASYAVPLAFRIFKDEYIPYVAEHLATAVRRKNTDDTGATLPAYSLMTGFIGTPAISEALSIGGHHDVAYKLLQQTSYPSWLYSVKNGATTIWERLNSYTVEEGFGGNNSMNSFNHYSFGAVGAWMYNYSLGIQRDPEHPGFKHFILQPTPDPNGDMTWAEGYYDSMYGRINSSWRVENDCFIYKATVPANTTATVYIPTIDHEIITEDSKPMTQVKGVKFIEFKNGRAVYELQSGSYEFTSII
jgi:alpha-L-rhamnosidase